MKLSEKDTLSDILMQEKDIIKVYSSFIPEGSSCELRGVLQDNMQSIADQQFSVFNAMQVRGYYATKNAQMADITETIDKFSQGI